MNLFSSNDKLKKVEDVWDKNWKNHFIPEVHPEIINLVKHYSTGKKILEIGFGSGGDLTELSNIGFNCWGIEKSKVAYSLSKKQTKFKSVLESGENTKFKNEEFDLIFHQGVLEHFKNPDKLMSESWRILKNGGILIIDVPHKWNLFTVYKNIFQIFNKWYGGWERSYDKNELKDLMKKSGFKTLKIRYRGIWPHQWGKFLYPETIVKNNIAKKILTSTPVRFFQMFIRKIYENNDLLKVVSSYNIIVVARKK